MRKILAAKASGALARLMQPVGRNAYLVYVSKSDDPHAIVTAKGFPTRDKAASACISLAEEGYKISKVKLPNGQYVMGEQIESAIRMGRSTVKVVLKR